MGAVHETLLAPIRSCFVALVALAARRHPGRAAWRAAPYRHLRRADCFLSDALHVRGFVDVSLERSESLPHRYIRTREGWETVP